jgi:hypothetical protein
LPDEFDHLACVGLFGRQIVEGDVRTFARDRDRGCTTDAGIAAGD